MILFMISESKFKELEIVVKFYECYIIVYFIVLSEYKLRGWQRGALPTPVYALRLRLRLRANGRLLDNSRIANSRTGRLADWSTRGQSRMPSATLRA